MSGRTIDIAEIIEAQKINPFWVRLLVVSWFVTFFDGFDMQVIAFAATYIAPDLDLTRRMLGDIFTIGIFGTLVGGVLFGFIGDKIGRRPAIIFATLSFGVLTFALGLARTYEHFLILRFVNGIMIGGALPLCWALNVEYAPRNARATVVTIIMLGYSLGGGLCGPVSVWLEPHYGWPSIFFFGGIGSLIAGAMLFFGLPESIRFLTARNRRPDLVAGIARRIAPKADIPDDAVFVLGDERKDAPKFKLANLFAGDLRIITPLLWATYIVSSMAVFFKASWSPIVLVDMGFTRPEAALMASLGAVAGALGGLSLMRFTDKLGPVSIAALPLVVIPLLLYAAFGQMNGVAFMALNTLIGFCIVGAHTGVTSIASIYYPSAFRANGAGWASSVAKIGSIAGPFIGGLVLSTAMPARYTFALLAICQLALTIFVGALGLYHGVIAKRRAAGGTAPAPSGHGAVMEAASKNS
jgi:AAHS family 4-hydroxybenzoate transporter-like MFS transporter